MFSFQKHTFSLVNIQNRLTIYRPTIWLTLKSRPTTGPDWKCILKIKQIEEALLKVNQIKGALLKIKLFQVSTMFGLLL
jgi:hypothetical protein